MSDNTYNGWTNHATWLVNVWTDGDNHIVRICSAKHQDLYDRSKDLKEYITDTYFPSLRGETCNSGLEQDLLQSALSGVNWRELVEHYEDCDTEEDNDE